MIISLTIAISLFGFNKKEKVDNLSFQQYVASANFHIPNATRSLKKKSYEIRNCTK